MHKGVFKSDNAKDKHISILILGESHHWSSEDWIVAEGETELQAEERRKEKAANYKTKTVVKNYLRNYSTSIDRDKAYRFFDKIVQAFGFEPESQREYFWDHVWFGNYIDELCGIGDSKATELLSCPSKCQEYNDQLFKFINNNEIKVVFCFSRRVYNHLPGLVKGSGEHEERINDKIYLLTKDGKHKTDYISYCKYLPDLSHKHTTEKLKESLEVYGMLHPSGQYGFDPQNYAPDLKKRIEF